MAHSSPIQRKLFMHSAHTAIGVFGDGIEETHGFHIERLLRDGLSLAVRHAALIAHPLDSDAQASLALFEQAAEGLCDFECCRIDLDTVESDPGCLAGCDSALVFRRGFHVSRRWADLDEALALFGPRDDSVGPIEIEPAPASRWHPVLEGVDPFVSWRNAQCRGRIPEDATILLTNKASGKPQPMAWACHRPGSRLFSTSLGCPADWRHPSFIRLALNAVAWIAR
jgi:hypothetical protein